MWGGIRGTSKKGSNQIPSPLGVSWFLEPSKLLESQSVANLLATKNNSRIFFSTNQDLEAANQAHIVTNMNDLVGENIP